MKTKHLNAQGQGESTYDYKYDILLFKVKERTYDHSLEIGNFVIDIDKEGFITGLRIMDASEVFDLSKYELKHVKDFSFSSQIQAKKVAVQLKFSCLRRNKEIIRQNQDILHGLDRTLKNTVVECSA